MTVDEDGGRRVLVPFSPLFLPIPCRCSPDGDKGKPAVLIHLVSLGRWLSLAGTEFRTEAQVEIRNNTSHLANTTMLHVSVATICIECYIISTPESCVKMFSFFNFQLFETIFQLFCTMQYKKWLKQEH